MVVARSLPSPVLSHRQDVLDRELVADIVGERDGDAYRVGPGDTLLVAVYGHPELSIAPYAGVGSISANNSRLSGLAIDNDGSIQFPLIGTAQVAGKTSAELRTFLEKALDPYVKDPKVTVQVVFTGSIRYYLLGQFTQPGLKYSDRPLRLLEALSLGGSVQLEQASLRSAYVARQGKRLPINFYRLVRLGDLSQNIRLRSGDVVMVPDNANERAYVFGGASGSNPKGGTVSFVNGRLSLLQALAQVGFAGLLAVRAADQGRQQGQRYDLPVHRRASLSCQLQGCAPAGPAGAGLEPAGQSPRNRGKTTYPRGCALFRSTRAAPCPAKCRCSSILL